MVEQEDIRRGKQMSFVHIHHCESQTSCTSAHQTYAVRLYDNVHNIYILWNCPFTADEGISSLHKRPLFPCTDEIFTIGKCEMYTVSDGYASQAVLSKNATFV